MKQSIEDILHILEAESFSELQKLMLKNNSLRSVFYSYTIFPPSFAGDKYKAFYYVDIKKLGSINFKGN